MKNILIADDDKTVRAVVGDFLTYHGFVVRAVEDGLQAVQQARVVRPDLIILDYEMPAASGAVVYGRLMDSGVAPSIPVIFLTGKMSALVKMRLLQSHGVRFLAKPVDLELLRSTVIEMLGPAAPSFGSSWA